MNIYAIIEDGESFCIKATDMAEATGVCLKSFLEDRKEDEGELYSEEEEIKFYHKEILESCLMVGVLRN